MGGSDPPLRRDGFPPPYQVRGHAFAGMTDGSALVSFVPAIGPGRLSAGCLLRAGEGGSRTAPTSGVGVGRVCGPPAAAWAAVSFGSPPWRGIKFALQGIDSAYLPRGCRRRSPADTWGSRIPPPQDVPGWQTARLIRLLSRLGLRPAKAVGLRWLRSFWVSPGVRTWNGGDLFGTGSPGGTPKRQTDLLLPPLVLSQHQLRQDPYKTGGDRSGLVWSTPLLACC